MRTIIFKPILLLVMIIGVAFISINAGQTVGKGTIKIEVVPGFTIEDIIQDLRDNGMTVSSTPVYGTTIHIIRYNSKTLDNTYIEQYLDNHPGAVVIYGR